MSYKFEGILFDLDGTLLDTALDLAKAANQVLKAHAIPGYLDDTTAREYASDGMKILLQKGATNFLSNEDAEKLKPEFLSYYNEHIADRTEYFPGIQELLNKIILAKIPMGTVTNKPHELALKLLNKFPETAQMRTIIGSSKDIKGKPAPDALLLCAEKLGVDPKKCVYLGDHIRDIEAGRNAGMETILAGWGYIKKDTNLLDFKANFIAQTPKDAETYIFED